MKTQDRFSRRETFAKLSTFYIFVSSLCIRNDFEFFDSTSNRSLICLEIKLHELFFFIFFFFLINFERNKLDLSLQRKKKKKKILHFSSTYIFAFKKKVHGGYYD